MTELSSKPVTGRELIYNVILNNGTTQFRNRDIVESTGIGRQQIADCLAVLMREGVLAKNGVYYYITDYSAYVRFMLSRSFNSTSLLPSKFLFIQPDQFEDLLGSLLLIQNVPGADDWKTVARLVRSEIGEEIDTAIQTLQGYRKMLNTERNSGAYSNRIARDKKYAAKIQKMFVTSAQHFAGIAVTGERITEHMVPALREFFRLDEE